MVAEKTAKKFRELLYFAASCTFMKEAKLKLRYKNNSPQRRLILDTADHFELPL